MQKIYWFSPGVKTDERLLYSDKMILETTLCQADPSHATRTRWPRPLKLIGYPFRTVEFEWTVYSDALVDENMARTLKSQGFSGFDLDPVEFYSTTETPLGKDSLEVKVTGWGGMAHPSSGIRVLKKCLSCGRTIFSGYTHKENLFDIDKWDGSDFFLIWPLPRYIFVVEEVAKFILNAGCSGVTIRELKDLPKVVAGTFTPGHIEDWYSKEKAAEIIRDFDK